MSAVRGFFITAVGTDIGKTLVTTILCDQLTRAGVIVRALKPIVSGFAPDDPASDPALILRSLGRAPSLYAVAAIAPWRFAAPVSPHLAARAEGKPIAIEAVAAFCQNQGDDHSVLLIEGAGGVMSPIDESHTVIDLIAALGLPVILVTGTYLGALSHSLTALAALDARKLRVQGIVVSESTNDVGLDMTIASLIPFAGEGMPIHALPRLAGTPEEKWRSAPSLTALCGV